jgi:hypothetical protein
MGEVSWCAWVPGMAFLVWMCIRLFLFTQWFWFEMLLFTFRGRFRTFKGMLVNVIAGGADWDTTGAVKELYWCQQRWWVYIWSKHWNGQDFGGHGGGIEGLQESRPFMTTRHAVQILNGEYDHLIGQYKDSENRSICWFQYCCLSTF